MCTFLRTNDVQTNHRHIRHHTHHPRVVLLVNTECRFVASIELHQMRANARTHACGMDENKQYTFSTHFYCRCPLTLAKPRVVVVVDTLFYSLHITSYTINVCWESLCSMGFVHAVWSMCAIVLVRSWTWTLCRRRCRQCWFPVSSAPVSLTKTGIYTHSD